MLDENWVLGGRTTTKHGLTASLITCHRASLQPESGVRCHVEWKSWKTGRLPPPWRASVVCGYGRCSAAITACAPDGFGLVERTRKLSTELVHTEGAGHHHEAGRPVPG